MPIRHAYLVEDNPTIRSNLIPTLSEMADVKVIGMAEGEHEAMDWLIRFANQADFIILDLFLAEGSGLGVLRQVAVHHIKIPIVVLTNYATQDIRERCKARRVSWKNSSRTVSSQAPQICIEPPYFEVGWGVPERSA